MPLSYIPRSRQEKSEEHQITIGPNKLTPYPAPTAMHQGGTSVYALVVACSCQWQALARDDREAAYYKASHLKAHGLQ